MIFSMKEIATPSFLNKLMMPERISAVSQTTSRESRMIKKILSEITKNRNICSKKLSLSVKTWSVNKSIMLKESLIQGCMPSRPAYNAHIYNKRYY